MLLDHGQRGSNYFRNLKRAYAIQATALARCSRTFVTISADPTASTTVSSNIGFGSAGFDETYFKCIEQYSTMKLVTRAGRAQSIRFSTNVSGRTGEHGSVSTEHIASFQLDGSPVQILANRPLTFEEGDEVIVAGFMKRGVLSGIACLNRTRQVLESQSWLGEMIFGAVSFAIGAASALECAFQTFTGNAPKGATWVISALTCVALAGLVIWSWSNRRREAERMVTRAI